MSTKEPQKRVVRWKEYAESAGKKGIMNSLGWVFLVGGLLLLIPGIPLVLSVVSGSLIGLCAGVPLSVFGLIGIFMSKTLFEKVEEMEPIALLTKENAKQLPEVETLVRASDLPPSHQQAELLRAAQTGPETPPEELLRATQGNRDNAA
jgi:hypothetical protein